MSAPSSAAVRPPTDTTGLSGAAILRAIKAAGMVNILSVPDITTSDGLLFPISRDPAFRLVRVSKEDETIGISAGLWHCGERSLILIQHTGFLDSINAVRAVAVEYDLPVCMMIGLLNKEPGVDPNDSAVYGVRIVKPILEAMGVAYVQVETDADVHRIGAAIAQAYERLAPIAILIGRSPTAP
jgi:sulfopyruvate decarboxylase TPP-binding subunit